MNMDTTITEHYFQNSQQSSQAKGDYGSVKSVYIKNYSLYLFLFININKIQLKEVLFAFK